MINFFKNVKTKLSRKKPEAPKPSPFEILDNKVRNSLSSFSGRSIAVLIDIDNVAYKNIEQVLNIIRKNGNITVCRAYGNWSKPLAAGPWTPIVKKFGMQPIHQIDYISGKNASDLAMAIDAMDLLYSDIYDGFVIISSDSDFTSLALRLKQNNKFVIGVGKAHTAESFRSATTVFIDETHLTKPEDVSQYSKEQLKKAITDIWNDYKTPEEDLVSMVELGSRLPKYISGFKLSKFGADKVIDLVKLFPKDFELGKIVRKGKNNQNAYKVITK